MDSCAMEAASRAHFEVLQTTWIDPRRCMERMDLRGRARMLRELDTCPSLCIQCRADVGWRCGGVHEQNSSSSSIRLPVAGLTAAATLAVPTLTWFGFAVAGAPLFGLAPAGIVLGTLWLLHHHLQGLRARLHAAEMALAEHAARTSQQRLDLAASERRVLDHERGLEAAHEATAYALAKLIEMRDPGTGAHLERVRAYVRVLTTQLAGTPQYRAAITDSFVDALYAASPLHDLGKIAIADGILLKPGKLTPEEFASMKRHTTIGARTLREASRRAGRNVFLEIGHELALYHHERWDGSGYPFGLARTQIPLGARIVALADVYDALTSQRCYKRAFSHEEARAYVVAESGRHFDPDLVEAFLQRERDFLRIRAAITSDVPLYGEDAPVWVRELRVRGAA